MNHVAVLKELIEVYEAYQKEGGKPNLAEFFRYGSAHLTPKESTYKTTSLESEILMYLVNMQKFGKSYLKVMLKNTPFSTPDEVIFLIGLRYTKPMTKSQLIEQNLMEKTSGVEVIKRLLKDGLITEKPNKDDKRSKLLSITSKGTQSLEKVMKKMVTTSHLVAGNLMNHEKKELVKALKKLNEYHLHLRHKKVHLSEEAIEEEVNHLSDSTFP